MFSLYILYEVKPLPNSLLIFVFSSLVVVFTAKTRTKLWPALNEVVGPNLSDG